jgi:hypothetical protein
LYVCTVLDDAATFEADMHYVTDGDPRRPIAQQIDYFGQYARSYWQGEKCDTAVVEILAPARSVQVVAEAKW